MGHSHSLLQVKHLPCRCRSCSSKDATVHRNRRRLALSMRSLLLSASLRMKLKLPVTAHGPVHTSLMASSSSKKSTLSPSSYGLYTVVSHHFLGSTADCVWAETETVIK